MASVTGTLSTAGTASGVFFLRAGETANVILTVTGTATVQLQGAAGQPAQAYRDLQAFTATTSGTLWKNTTGASIYLRLYAVSLGGGSSVAYTVEDVSGDQVLEEWRAADGTLAFRITDQGPMSATGPSLDVRAFGAVGDGVTDDTAAIQAAIDAAVALGGAMVILAPCTGYRITSGLTVDGRLILQGNGSSAVVGDAYRTAGTIIKDGNFTALTIRYSDVVVREVHVDGATGNGGDGIVVGSQRVVLSNVSVHRQGSRGVVVGITGVNCNLWRLNNIITLSNGSHGVHITDPDASAPDVNAGLMQGLDSRTNTGDGLLVDNAFDNAYFGVSCQTNTGYGIRLLGVSGLECEGQNFWYPYTENNTAGDILLGEFSNYCSVWGYRTGSLLNDAVVNSGTNNLVLGHYGSELAGPFFRSALQFASVLVNNTAISGQWQFTQAADRSLNLKQVNSSAATAEKSIEGQYGETYREGMITELITLDTGAAFTDSATNLLPANSIIESVVVRVIVTIGTAANYQIGDATTVNRFRSTTTTITAGGQLACLNQMQGGVATDAAGPVQVTAAPIRITCNTTPSAGQLRVTVFYKRFTAPTS